MNCNNAATKFRTKELSPEMGRLTRFVFLLISLLPTLLERSLAMPSRTTQSVMKNNNSCPKNYK